MATNSKFVSAVFKISKTKAVLYLFNLDIFSCTSQMVLLRVVDLLSVSNINGLTFRRLEKIKPNI